MKTTQDTLSPFTTRAVALTASGLRFNLNGIALTGSIMDTEEIINKVETRHGQISTVTIIDLLDGKMKKRNNPFYGTGLLKISSFQIRCGVAYERKATTIEKRESGIEAQSPKGKVWIDFPFWMKSLKTNRVLLACSSIKNKNSKSFFVNPNFQEVDKETLAPFMKTRSEFAPEWYTIELSKIVRVV